MAFNPPKDEMKELIRAIEDKREARIQLQISNSKFFVIFHESEMFF